MTAAGSANTAAITTAQTRREPAEADRRVRPFLIPPNAVLPFAGGSPMLSLRKVSK
ncbi:hypothetical protein GCM10023191_009820 [Actinoallomurus oryzae]|uniref:Uncharacterized protein n=1 Tax=Actinoallomurus oryzae TaxID=502180 RepID=A0ABP8PEK8_9ACTN